MGSARQLLLLRMRSSLTLLLLVLCRVGVTVAAGEGSAGSGGAVRMDSSTGEPKPKTAPDPPLNPHTSAGDTTSECYTWAADGQCRLNPGFMLTSCKYSCWEWCVHACVHACMHVSTKPRCHQSNLGCVLPSVRLAYT